MSRGLPREDFLSALAVAVATSKHPSPKGGVTVDRYLLRYRHYAAQTGLLCAKWGLWRVEAKGREQ